MATLLDKFKTITQALNAAEIDYAVCGGWARAIHVLPRTTVDIGQECLIRISGTETGTEVRDVQRVRQKAKRLLDLNVTLD